MNEENLKPNSERSPSEIKEMTTKGGINSGKARRKKANIKKAIQAMIDGTYNTTIKKNGVAVGQITLSGDEMIAQKLFQIATNEKDKNCITAIKLIIELTGQNKDTLTDKKTKTEIKLLEARIKALSGLDDGETKKLLDNINKILNDVDSVIE